MLMQWAKQKQAGFTIVELLIVVVVIAILAAITVVAYNGIQQQASRSVAQNATSQAAKKVMAYAVDNADTYPTTLALVGINDSDSTKYQYDASNTIVPKAFCVTVTVKGFSYYQNNSDKTTPTQGACSGHSEGNANPGNGGNNGGDNNGDEGTTPDPEPLACATGYLVVPGNSQFGTSDFCVMKYEAKNSGGAAVSFASNTPWVTINQTNAIARSAESCSGCKLITEAEWLTIAHNLVNVPSNWSSGVVGTGYIFVGHSDTSPAYSLNAGADTNGYLNTGSSAGNQRRTLSLSNGEVIWDFAGNVNEWTSGQARGGQPGTGSGLTAREWNVLTTQGSMTPSPFPAFGTPAASNWTSAQGIGKAATDASSSTLRGVVRGGGFSTTAANSGIFTMNLSYTPATGLDTIGFRVTY